MLQLLQDRQPALVAPQPQLIVRESTRPRRAH